MATKKTLTGPNGIKLVLDHGDADTPAMVYNRDESASASYDCAVGSGALMHDSGTDIILTNAQVGWLDDQINAVETAFGIARKDHPEYN